MHSRGFRRAILAALLTLIALAPALAQQAPTVLIARIAGTVEVQNAKANKGRWTAAKKDQQIGSGWSLRTGFDGKVQLVFPLDNVVILKSNSVLTVDKLDDGGGASVNAKSGGLLANLEHALSAGSQFEVKTPKAMAVVRGTKFGVNIVSATGGAGAGDEASATGGAGAGRVQHGGGGGAGDEAAATGGAGAGRVAVPAVQLPILLPEADANGDGLLDILVNGAAIQELQVFLNREAPQAGDGSVRAGDGSVKPGDGSVRAGDGSVRIEPRDTTGDGVADLLLTFLGRPTGDVGEVNVGTQEEEEFTLIPAGDVDGDGVPDYVLDGDGRGGALQDAYDQFLNRQGVGDVNNRPAATETKPDKGNATDVGASGVPAVQDNELPAVQNNGVPAVQSENTYAGRPIKPSDFSGPGTVNFYGYRGVVDVFNDKGHSALTADTTIGVGDGPPSPAAPSGPEADQFLQGAENTAAFDASDAAALGTTSDLAAIRAELNAIDKRLKQIEADWKRLVREQAHGQLLLLWRDVLDLRDRANDTDLGLWRQLGNEQHPLGEYDAMVDWMQQHGVPDTDLPALLKDIIDRINALKPDIEPLLEGDQELKDRTQGTIERGNPQLGTRDDLIDTDNDGVGDALELLIGTDPVRSNDTRGFIELVAPDNNETITYPGTASIDFEFDPLDTDLPAVYDLVLESAGRQVVRRNAHPRERFTLAELVGPSGSFAGNIGPGGLLPIDWHVQAQLTDRASRTRIPLLKSETRRLNIQTPGNTVVEVNLRGPSTAKAGSPVTITGDITDVTALGSWEITIAYDPAILRFGTGNKTGLFASSTVFFNDNGNGTLVVSGSAPRGSAGITGAGDIFTLGFTALTAGDVEVAVTRVTLHDTLGNDIPARPGDSADVRVTSSLRPSSTPPPPPAPGPAGVPVAPPPPIAPQAGSDSAGLAPLGPITLIAPKPGESFPYPGTDEVEFRFDELRTQLDVVYNLILSSGGVRQQHKDVSTGEIVKLSSLVGKGSGFANQIGADGKLSLDWQIEAEVDTGAAQPTKVLSETRSFEVVMPQNTTVTFDLANGGSSRVQAGDSVRIRGSLSQINALGSFELGVRFDSSVLAFGNGKKLGLFSGANVQFDTTGSDHVTIRGSAAGAGLSGDGDCFELEFTAKADGAVTVEPEKAVLNDVLGRLIQSAMGDSVDITVYSTGRGQQPGGNNPPGYRDPFGKP